MSETVYNFLCPLCYTMIYYSNGDESDFTKHDTTHLVCCWCDGEFLIPGLEDLFPDPDAESPYDVRMVGQSYPDQQSALKGVHHVMNFIDSILAGQAKPSDIDDWIDLWHDRAAHAMPLHKYLGMSWAEYRLYVRGEISVEEIVAARQASKPTKESPLCPGSP